MQSWCFVLAVLFFNFLKVLQKRKKMLCCFDQVLRIYFHAFISRHQALRWMTSGASKARSGEGTWVYTLLAFELNSFTLVDMQSKAGLNPKCSYSQKLPCSCPSHLFALVYQHQPSNNPSQKTKMHLTPFEKSELILKTHIFHKVAHLLLAWRTRVSSTKSLMTSSQNASLLPSMARSKDLSSMEINSGSLRPSIHLLWRFIVRIWRVHRVLRLHLRILMLLRGIIRNGVRCVM